MAVLTQSELSEIRRGCAKNENPNWTSPQIDAASQAIEDFFETTGKAAISIAIDAATSPFVFSNAIKKKSVAHWFKQKFRREGV